MPETASSETSQIVPNKVHMAASYIPRKVLPYLWYQVKGMSSRHPFAGDIVSSNGQVRY